MYSIYIRYFLAPTDWENAGELVPNEYKMYDMPAEYPGDETLIEPHVKNEMGKAGSFEFAMESTNPWYGSLNQLTTLMRVVYDGDTIFYGRVLNIDTDMWGRRKVHCEGALAFLIDTLSIATKEHEREKISLAQYISNVITSHNNMVTDEPTKQFVLGEVPGHYSASIPADMRPVGDMRKYGSGSWTTTMNCLEDLSSKYGGYWRVRYEESDYVDTIGRWGQGNIDLNNRPLVHNPDGSFSTELSFSVEIDGKEVLLPSIIDGIVRTQNYAIQYYRNNGKYLGKFNTVAQADDYAERLHERQQWYYGGKPKTSKMYLDWFKNMFYPQVNAQPMRVAENIIDMQKTVDVNGIFTVFIPEGSKDGNPVYLDDIPKTVVKIPNQRTPVEPIGPGMPEDDPEET